MRKRRILSILMALALCLSLLPATALAGSSTTCQDGENCTHEAAVTVNGTTTHYDTIAAALKAAGGQYGTGGTVTLLKGSFLKSEDSATAGKVDTYSTFIYTDITLDLNKKTLTCNADYAGISVRPGVHFTIQNGTFANLSNNQWACAIEASKDKDINGTGCIITVEENATIKANYGIYAVGYTEIYVNNSKIEGNYPVYGAGPANKVTLDGATITGSVYGVCQESYNPDVFGGKNIAESEYFISNSIISGDFVGVCISSNKGIAAENHQLTVENCTINGANGIAVQGTDVEISGQNTSINANASDGLALAVLHNGKGEDTPEGAVGNVTIEAGNFKGPVVIQEPEGNAENEATITISGGTFDTNVTAYLADGMMQDESGNVINIVSAKSITLDKAELQMYTDGTEKLTATVTPDSTTDTIVWSSGKEAVATVDQNGLVKAVAPGTAVITVSSQGNPNVKATCTVTVTNAPVPVESISLDQGTLWLCWDTGRTAPRSSTPRCCRRTPPIRP